MNNNIIGQGQNLVNKTIVLTGAIDNIFAMAIANGISITDDIPTGTTIEATKSTNANAVQYFLDHNKQPATS